MRYMGGKTRLAKHIAPIIQEYVTGDTPFYSLFCGSMAIEQHVKVDSAVFVDLHPTLAHMWQTLYSHGTEWLPVDVSEDDYYTYREVYKNRQNHNNLQVAEATWGLFACSFGGKFDGGYARYLDYNFADVGRRSVAKDITNIRRNVGNPVWLQASYADIGIPDGAVVYCDPPYANTTSYKGSGKFDSEAYWEWCRETSKRCTVFTSEYTAPDDFEAVWSKDVKLSLRSKDGCEKRVEKLFKYKG